MPASGAESPLTPASLACLTKPSFVEHLESQLTAADIALTKAAGPSRTASRSRSKYTMNESAVMPIAGR
ncbi:MAG: hypothetical protein ACRDOI_44420 [Trebonia sp.]